MHLDFLTSFHIVKILSTTSSILMSLLGITSIIVFHEFGHFIFCKLFKVYTPTFSIGIGKKLYTKMIGDTEFCISAGPLGGYVEIASEATHGKKGFNSINYLQKFLIMLGGIGFNMLFAYIVFSLLFYIGMPDSAFMPYENTTPVIQTVNQESINHESLQAGDTIVTINDQAIDHQSEKIKEAINTAVAAHHDTLYATVQRDGQEHSVIVHINCEKGQSLLEQRLEISLQRKAPLSLRDSIMHGIKLTHFYIGAIFESMKSLISASTTQSLAGPIMTLASSTKVAQKGLKSLLIFLAIISINLGIMNLLPLPIFDGGQFVIFTIETVLGREMSEGVKEKIGSFSWFLILSLMIVFSIKDVYILVHQYIL